jgi:hypothetical protein
MSNDASIGGSLRVSNCSSIGVNLPYAQIDVSNGNKLVMAGNYYGQLFQLAESLGSNTTTSGTPQTKVTLTTSNLPSALYRITVAWVGNNNSTNQDMIFDVRLNGVTLGTRGNINVELQDATTYLPFSRVFYRTLSGVNTILLRYWSDGGTTTTISDATIELIRVS